MNYWLRFGLPIGSAFVSAVILDNVIAFDWLLKETVLASANETIKGTVDSYYFHSDQYPVLYVFLRAVLSLTLWAILVKTPKTYLYIWIIAAVALDFLRHGNLKMIFDALSSFNIYLFILMPVIRVYLFLIFIEVARVIEKQKEPRLLVGSYDGADDDLQSLVPIGYDALGVWKYYNRFQVLGTRILLTVDLVWTFIALPPIKAALGGFGGLLITLIGLWPTTLCFEAQMDRFGLNGYCIGSIIQRQPSGVVIWRLLYFIFIILVIIAFGIEFFDTRAEPTEQGIISTLILAFMLVFKFFLYWFSTGIENSMELVDFSTNPNNEIAQIEAAASEVSFQGTDGGQWVVTPAAPLTPLSGRVIITELEGRDSRLGWETRSGRVSRDRDSRLGWGSQPGIAVGASREGGIQHGWGSQPGLRLGGSRDGGDSTRPAWGSQSVVSDSRGDEESFRSGIETQSDSVRTSREAVSTVSSNVSGWTTASGRDSRSDMR